MQAFTLLARLRFLRSTALDVFGYTAERRRERADPGGLSRAAGHLVAGLGESNYTAALELARLPAKLRGFAPSGPQPGVAGAPSGSCCGSSAASGRPTWSPWWKWLKRGAGQTSRGG